MLKRRAYKNSWAKAKRHRLRAEKNYGRQLFGLEGTSFDDQQTIRYNEAIVTTNAESISATAESLETTSFDDLQTICNNGATVTANAESISGEAERESLDVVRTVLTKGCQ